MRKWKNQCNKQIERVNFLIYQELLQINKTNATTLIENCAKAIQFNEEMKKWPINI